MNEEKKKSLTEMCGTNDKKKKKIDVCAYTLVLKANHGISKIKQEQHVVQDCVKFSNFLILLPFRRYAIYLDT